MELCFLRLRKCVIILRRLPDIPFCLNLQSRPLYRLMLSNAFDMSRKTVLALRLLWKD